MKAFIAGGLAAIILAIAAAVVLDTMIQSTSGEMFSNDNVRLGDPD